METMETLLLGGWDPRTDVSSDRITPIKKRHEVKGHLEGVPQRQLRDLRSPGLLTTYPNWDDPPSIDTPGTSKQVDLTPHDIPFGFLGVE